MLTIAGSDSGGAAGLQADLRTFATLKVYGLNVLTVVTAQNSQRVEKVQSITPDFVAAQLDAVASDYGVVGEGIQAAKTGFIGRVDLIETIAGKIEGYRLPNLVADPVLVNHKGAAMFSTAVAQAYRDRLLPLATLITPNWREASLLLDEPIETLADLETAVHHLRTLGPCHVLITGFRDGGEIVDLLLDGEKLTYFRSPYIPTQNTHGSGDTLSAAVCAYLAWGDDVRTAVGKAHQFTVTAIWRSADWQLGQGHGPVWQI